MALKYKIAISFGLLLTLIVIGFWLTLKLQLQQSLNQQTDTLGQVLAKQTADSVTELVLANDLLGLNVVVNQLAQEPGITRALITNVDGRPLAPTVPQTLDRSSTATTYQAAITLQDSVAGHVFITLDESLLSNPLSSPRLVFYSAIVIGLLFTLILALILASQVTRPVKALIRDIDNPDGEEDELRALEPYELGILQQKVYELLNRQLELEEQITVAGLPDPAEEDTGPPPARRRLATLLTVRLSDSQQAIELLHPGTLAMLLQQFQFYLRQASRLYRGVITRIDGDCILVTFDSRRCQNDHAFNALCCAQLFILLMRKVAEKHRKRNAQSLDFDIAVHSGEVYFSPLWSKKLKDGTCPVQQESVIGKPVATTLALLEHVGRDQMLVSAFSYQLAGGQTRFATDEHQMKRVIIDDTEFSTYRLNPETGVHTELLMRQCQHMIPDPSPADTQQEASTHE